MTQEKIAVGNIKTLIGLQKTETLPDVLDDYVEKTDIITDPTTITDATENTKILSAKATKEAIDNKSTEVEYTQTITSTSNGAYKIGTINIDNTPTDIYGKDTQLTLDDTLTNSNNPVKASGIKTVTDALDTRITALETNSLSIVILGANDDLPQTGSNNKLYFKPNNGSNNNLYDEYAWTGSAFEKVGSKEIDLTNYIQKTELKNYVSAEIITTGNNAGDLNLIFNY